MSYLSTFSYADGLFPPDNGSSGLGFATIQHLVRHGAKIYMAARSEAKAKDAIAKLDFGTGKKGTVEWLELDLSDPKKAKESAERFMKLENRLDILGGL